MRNCIGETIITGRRGYGVRQSKANIRAYLLARFILLGCLALMLLAIPSHAQGSRKVPIKTPIVKAVVRDSVARSREPELPRVFLDTRMPVMPHNGDTLTVWNTGITCVGPYVASDSRCPQYNAVTAKRRPLPPGSVLFVPSPAP